MLAIAAKKLKKDQTEFIFNVIKNSDSNPIIEILAVEEEQDQGISEIIGQDYTGTKIISTAHYFHQLFYGPELYSKLFQNSSKFSDPGLIEKHIDF